MWKLTNVHAENLCAFQHLDWEVPQDVTTLVFGNNLDNDAQGSNGSGKSALIEAIAVGITGDPLRKVKSDEIIRDDADAAVIALTFAKSGAPDTFSVKRVFSRKAPQSIELLINGEPEVCACVNDYNKAVLDLIGLSKEDLYSNFILSRSRYISFLSSSDKDKKELINRFSNGILVDEAIEALCADTEPVRQRLQSTEKTVSYQEGKISAIKEQLAVLENDADAKRKNRELNMENLRTAIAQRRASIRESRAFIKEQDGIWAGIEEMEIKLEEIEASKIPFEDTVKSIRAIWLPSALGPFNDHTAEMNRVNDRIESLQADNQRFAADIRNADEALKTAQYLLASCKIDYDKAVGETQERKSALENSITILSKKISEQSAQVSELCRKRQAASNRIAELSAMIAGAVTCPNCGHKWILQCDTPIENMREAIDEAHLQETEAASQVEIYKRQITEANDQIAAANIKIAEVSDASRKAHEQYNQAASAVSRAETLYDKAKNGSDQCVDAIRGMHRKLVDTVQSLFTTAYSQIDAAISKCDTAIKARELQIKTDEGAIDNMSATLQDMENYKVADLKAPLHKSLAEAETALADAVERKAEAEAELDALTVQEARFVSFKTYLANTKINALSSVTNRFLEDIGSDIRIAFSGYTILKTGKVRDKISITLMRDGIDRGSFGKFSQGERSRCELAVILALQQLMNANCDEGKGLDLLVVDEILDGIDEDGLSSIFEALGKLKVTSLVVSHGGVAEGYPHRLIITKHNGISTLNEK